MSESQCGDEGFERMARETLTAELQLMDPAWGGVYQYSTDGDWEHPHFEKIMQRQADDLRIYAEAYALWHDKTCLSAALRIRGFLKKFLTSPDGAFYTSQDADLIPGQHGGEYFQLSDSERQKKVFRALMFTFIRVKMGGQFMRSQRWAQSQATRKCLPTQFGRQTGFARIVPYRMEVFGMMKRM
jgi:uncharacterized protein YyaL (SSP411 family)